jgi:hypothetical protein
VRYCAAPARCRQNAADARRGKKLLAIQEAAKTERTNDA